jgi:hypothetical protein
MIQSGAMPSLRSSVLLFVALALPALGLPGLAMPAAASDHAPPPVTPATSFPAVEVHAREHVAIAADPYETKARQSIFRVQYAKYGVVPIRLIVTNLGDTPISLRDARILFETAAGQRVQAAEPEDVERLMNSAQPHASLPAPSPIPQIPGLHRDPAAKNTKKVEQDFSTFEYGAIVVEPHTTRAGFLFYILPGLKDPLRGADLYLNDLRGADGGQLFPFQISFNPYLDAQKNQSR